MGFLDFSLSRFRQYKRLADKAMAQLPDVPLLQQVSSDSNNSIVIIVKHMHGNMLSRWTNFLTEDGEKRWRQREEEFVHEVLTREQLLDLWEEGWARLFASIEALSDQDLDRTIYIRQEPLPVMDAILRQLSHYSYHVGQIVLLCKQAVGDRWESLSIPKGGSAAYNASMSEKAGVSKGS